MANRVAKKQAMLARKEQLLNELRYYERRVDEARNTQPNTSSHVNDSSDSEQEFDLDIGPSIIELKLQQSMLKTCLHATQELTSLQVLQSQVNVMVDDPIFDGEPQITEEGVWRDVMVECRVDLVPFSISFYAHKPNRLFAPVSYSNLQVTVVKPAHERELSKSVLSSVKTPSEAIEVLRGFARAHRSRRSSLARLADAYAHTLAMEPAPEGGYILKCKNLLEVSWTLQNKWSPIAPFHHKMKFDVEYMDESYIKIIAQAHRQLSDPAIETDERTLLLSKIIKTCLDAERPTELQQSVESGSPTEKNQTLDGQPEVAAVNNKEREIMAPPKYPPKKTKPKGKENSLADPKDKKRPSEEIGSNTKKSKTDLNNGVSDKNKTAKNKDTNEKITNEVKAKTNKVNIQKDNTHLKKLPNNINKNEVTTKNAQKTSNVNDLKPKTNSTNKPKDIKPSDNELKSTDVASSKNDKKKDFTEKTDSSKTKKDPTLKTNEGPKKKAIDLVSNGVKSLDSVKPKTKNTNDILEKEKKLTAVKGGNNPEKSKKTGDTAENNDERVKGKDQQKQQNLIERFSTKKVASSDQSAINKKIIHSKRTSDHNKNIKNNKITIIKDQAKKSIGLSQVKKMKISKIPQKRLSSENAKKNPHRISPRKSQSISNSLQDSSKASVNSMQKIVTSIPRLLKKPPTKP